jgi:hypothetical protein
MDLFGYLLLKLVPPDGIWHKVSSLLTSHFAYQMCISFTLDMLEMRKWKIDFNLAGSDMQLTCKY